jgi:hypothetical protein
MRCDGGDELLLTIFYKMHIISAMPFIVTNKKPFKGCVMAP